MLLIANSALRLVLVQHRSVSDMRLCEEWPVIIRSVLQAYTVVFSVVSRGKTCQMLVFSWHQS
jgi:hypothetical protein